MRVVHNMKGVNDMREPVKYRGYTITWFPMEEQYMVFKDSKIKSGFLMSVTDAEIVIDNLEE